MNNPLDDEKRQIIQDALSEVTTTFAAEFMRGFKNSLVLSCKEEAAAKHAGGPEYKLAEAPPPKEILKMGSFTKRGNFVKNWKKRWFVAGNEFDNYTVYYYKTETKAEDYKVDGEGKRTYPKPKGEIKIAGYQVTRGTKEGEELTLILDGDDEQRQWLLKFDDEESLKGWQAIFEVASKRAEPPKHEDPIVHDAFVYAYRETRWKLWLWGYWCCDRSEEDMLGMLMSDLCDRRVMNELYATLDSGSSLVKQMVKKTVNGMIRAAASSAWKAAIGSVGSSKNMLVTAVKSALSPLMEFEPKMKMQITSGINDKLQPIVNKCAQENAKKVFDCIVNPVSAIYIGAVKGFAAGFPEERGITWRYGDSLFSQGGVWAEFDKIATSDALAVLTDILSGRSSIGLAYDCVYDAAHLLHKAEVDYDQVSKGDKGACLAKLKCDAKIHLEFFVLGLLGGIIGDPVAEAMKPILDSALEPICSTIPEPLKEICDPQQVASDVVDDVVRSCLRSMLGKSLDGAYKSIDAL